MVSAIVCTRDRADDLAAAAQCLGQRVLSQRASRRRVGVSVHTIVGPIRGLFGRPLGGRYNKGPNRKNGIGKEVHVLCVGYVDTLIGKTRFLASGMRWALKQRQHFEYQEGIYASRMFSDY